VPRGRGRTGTGSRPNPWLPELRRLPLPLGEGPGEGPRFQSTFAVLFATLTLFIGLAADDPKPPQADLKGHTAPIFALAATPDGKTLASGDAEGVVKLWDVASGRVLANLEGHKGAVLAAAFGDGGKTLATAGADRTVRLWDVATRTLSKTLEGHRGEVLALAFSRDGKTLASGSNDRMVRLWDVSKGETTRTIESPDGSVRGVAFGPEGQVFAAGEAAIWLWTVADGAMAETFTFRLGSIDAIAASHDGKFLAAGGGVGRLMWWEVASKKQGHEVGLPGQNLAALAFAPDGKRLAVAANPNRAPSRKRGVVFVYDFPMMKLANPPAPAPGLDGPADLEDTLRGVLRGATPPPLRGHLAEVQAIAFLDNDTLASAGRDRTIRIWRPADGRLVATFRGAIAPGEEKSAPMAHLDRVVGVDFAPDGKTVATACEAGTVTLWDPTSHLDRLVLQLPGGAARCVAYAPDGKLLAAAGDGRAIHLFDPDSGKEVASLKSDAGAITSLAFSRDGAILACGSRDGTARTWDVASRRETAVLAQHTSAVTCVALSRDGKTLATGGLDWTVKLWDLARGEVRAELEGHKGPITAVAFRPDGKGLATAAEDG
jgi:WD40 repeat protein